MLWMWTRMRRRQGVNKSEAADEKNEAEADDGDEAEDEHEDADD